MLWPVAIAAGAAVGLVVRMAYEAFRATVRVEEIVLPRLPASFDGTRIFFYKRFASPDHSADADPHGSVW